ncbi:uncharacterized protein LOC112164377 [Rosa chinensis]|uniref:uncharacterized protein LOC112164377 n=1 Tax=Rosa chinensis TaxID=74649 RepID=UPI000D0914BA|nr:uncharacterized protein LOC112164377 [Rosa chinensis]
MEWAVPFLHEIFSPTEVDVIASIPLSVRTPDDKRVWHWDKRGVYSVKSGYHAYRLTENVSNLASSSRSSGRAADLHWKVLWKARVPPKVRSFIWRMHREIIPTRAALAKKCAILDSSCVFCNNYQEDALHVFKGCKRVEEFWNLSPLKLKLLQEYHDAHPIKMTKRMRQRTKWKLPPRGRLKLNTDGAFFSETGKGGIGAIIRDENGVCVAAIARPFSHV